MLFNLLVMHSQASCRVMRIWKLKVVPAQVQIGMSLLMRCWGLPKSRHMMHQPKSRSWKLTYTAMAM